MSTDTAVSTPSPSSDPGPAADLIPAPPPAHRVVIEPSAGWAVDVGELWRYRELLLTLVWRDVKVRYKQTVLGAAWAVLQPAMQMAVFTVFFGRLAKLGTGGVPEPLFFLTGILPWMFFANAVGSAANSVLSAERLITKIYFPRLAVPLAAVAAAFVDFCVSCVLLVLMCGGYAAAGYDVLPGPAVVLVPVVAGVVAVLAAGLGTALAALNVTYRDFRYIVPFFLQLGMFATPTIYMKPPAEPGPVLSLLLTVNPMNGLVSAFRAAAIGAPFPWDGLAAVGGAASAVGGAEMAVAVPFPWAGLAVGAAAAVGALAAGAVVFRRTEDSFADLI